ncbi:MAG: CARDB domain-containing protein, partial [Halobacteria archaeon]|nr:CARDB domain-containing protein [Halobacteria archaeon]
EVPPFQIVFNQSASASYVEGDELWAKMDITNQGNLQDTQTIKYRVKNIGVVDSQDVTLGAGQTKTVNLSWSIQEGQAGQRNITFVSKNGTQWAWGWVPITVKEDPHFDVSITGTNSPVNEGNTLEVTTDVQNTGGVEGTQNVELVFNGSTVDSQQLTVGAGNTTSVTFTHTTSSSAGAETYTAEVVSQDDSASTQVDVCIPGWWWVPRQCP